MHLQGLAWPWAPDAVVVAAETPASTRLCCAPEAGAGQTLQDVPEPMGCWPASGFTQKHRRDALGLPGCSGCSLSA